MTAMRSAPRGSVSLALAILAAMLALGCGGGTKPRGRVLVIGIDGASPKLAMPMLEHGRLPNLAAIAEAGVSGKLRSVLPLYSPRIWNTIATSRKAGQHGVPAFVKKDESGRKHLYLSHDRKVPALWNILTEHGLSVAVVNWWTTYPPEKINGVMVSDHFFPEQISMIKQTFKDDAASSGALVHPESWSERANELLAASYPLTEVANPFQGNETIPHWINRDVLSRQFETDGEITRVSLGIQQEFRPDVMLVLLPGIDRVSHWLWGNLEPDELYPPPLQPTPEEKQAGAEALRLYYQYTDGLIGRLSEDYGPEDLVIVLSDHGFEAGVSLMLLTGEHDTQSALDGVIFARGDGIPAGRNAGLVNVYQIVPSVLAWLDLPIASDMVGRPAPFLGIEQPRMIASYDGIAIERVSVESSGREEEIVEQLRALGYLEEEAGGGEAPSAEE